MLSGVEPVLTPVVPGLGEYGEWRSLSRLEPFANGVIYSVRVWGAPLRAPLHYLSSLQGGA